jgi:hypothetical protein
MSNPRHVLVAAEETAHERARSVDATHTRVAYLAIEDARAARTVQHPFGLFIGRVFTGNVVSHFFAEDFDQRFADGVAGRGLYNKSFATVAASTYVLYSVIPFQAFLAFVFIVVSIFIQVVLFAGRCFVHAEEHTKTERSAPDTA